MKLKKNDKIILIVGVVILIASGAGIALYNVEDSDDSSLKEDTEETFEYSWEMNSIEKTIGSDLFAAKKTPYENTLDVTAPKNSVLTKVELIISWKDDSTYGLLKKNKGLDTLQAEITYNGDMESIESIGEGNESVMFTINNMPKTDSVQALNEQEAKDHINEMISGDNTASFDFIVSVTPGEKFWRPLKKLRDSGNDFDVIASYTYYTFKLESSDSSSNDGEEDITETGDDFGHNIGEFYVNLGYGRGMI